MQRVGVVDSDQSTLTSVSCALEAEGYQVAPYTNGHSALGGLTGNPADLVILAMQLSGLDGLEILRRLHQTCYIPVILLTSKDHDEIDDILGLRMGADDIIHKPFSPHVLAQRVKTVLNRLTKGLRLDQKEDDAVQGAAIECGEIHIDAARYVCTWKNKPVRLTRVEILLLQAMVSHPGMVRDRDILINAAHDGKVDVNDRVIDTHIKRLRKKLKAADPSFDMIEAVRGMGYRFRRPMNISQSDVHD